MSEAGETLQGMTTRSSRDGQAVETRNSGEAVTMDEENSVHDGAAAVIEDNKEEGGDQEENESEGTAETCTTGTAPPSTRGEEAATDGESVSVARPSNASGQTVADLDQNEKLRASTATSTRTYSSTPSQPGAFSMGGSEQRAGDEAEETDAISTDDDAQRLQAVDSNGSERHSDENRKGRARRKEEEETKEEESEPLSPNSVEQSPSIEAVENTSAPPPNADATADHVNDKHAHRQDEEPAEEVPMIVAELVPPPVQAVQVIYDEHAEANIDPEEPPGLPPAINNLTLSPEDDLDKELPCIWDKFVPKRYHRRLGWWMCILSTCCSIAIPVTVNLAFRNHEDTVTAVDSSPPATIPPSYPYECFDSTKKVIRSQIDNPEQDLFIMCPNVRIRLGVLANAAAGNTNIVNGDAPLMILRENVEVRCGLDGSVRNNCILDGGFLQVLLTPDAPSELTGVWKSTPTNNVTIRGLTLTGQLVSDFTLGGSSIVISNPGHTVQMIDCLWENMTAPSGLVYVGTNPFQLYSGSGYLDLHAASLAVVNSTFRNITYDGVLVEVVHQIVTLQGCQFQDLQLSVFASECGFWYVEGDIDDAWCQGLFYCLEDSICTMEDICVQNFEYAGPASLLVATKDSDVTLTGTVFTDELVVPGRLHSDSTCPDGLAWIDSEKGTLECMEATETEETFTKVEQCALPLV